MTDCDWQTSGGLFDWTLQWLVPRLSDDRTAELLRTVVDENLGNGSSALPEAEHHPFLATEGRPEAFFDDLDRAGGRRFTWRVAVWDAGRPDAAPALSYAPALVERYHAMKSASLFRLAAAAGARAAVAE